MSQSKFLSYHLFSWTTSDTTCVSPGPWEMMQNKINHARNVLEVKTIGENGAAKKGDWESHQITMQVWFWVKEWGRKIGCKHLTPQCSSKDSLDGCFSISQSHLSEESGISQEWAYLSICAMLSHCLGAVHGKQNLGANSDELQRAIAGALIQLCSPQSEIWEVHSSGLHGNLRRGGEIGSGSRK